MKRAIPLIFLVVGVILLFWGFNESQSFMSDMKETFTGSPSNDAKWLIILGVVGVILGIVGFTRSRL